MYRGKKSCKRGKGRIMDLSVAPRLLYESEETEHWHQDGYFKLRGPNGVLLDIAPKGVTITILDRNLEPLQTGSKSVYYFNKNDTDKMILVEIKNGETYDTREYIFNPYTQAFEEWDSNNAPLRGETRQEMERRLKATSIARQKSFACRS